jgi:hypothetical protein
MDGSFLENNKQNKTKKQIWNLRSKTKIKQKLLLTISNRSYCCTVLVVLLVLVIVPPA